MNTPLTPIQILVTILAAALATILTRFTPYLFFPEGRRIPKFINYLSRVLAPAVFGMLVMYCLRNVSLVSGNHALPELISIGVVTALYLWRRDMVLPMAGGTLCYMLLIRLM